MSTQNQNIKNDSNPPSISVVMPVFNGSLTISESLDSIFKQTLQPIEIIVVDDGSTDNTLEVLAGYGDSITVIKTTNKGHASARNTGMKEATGEFIAILDADDQWTPGKLSYQIEACAEADVIYTAVRNFGAYERVDAQTMQDGECVQGDHLCPLILENFIPHSSVLVRLEAIKAVGGYDPTFLTAPDWDLWLRMAQDNMRFHGLPEPRTLYRWDQNSTSKNHLRTCDDRIRAVSNAIARSDPQRVSQTIRRQAIGNAWGTSAWFAAEDQPRQAITWYLRALRQNPTSKKFWRELLSTVLKPIRTTGKS